MVELPQTPDRTLPDSVKPRTARQAEVSEAVAGIIFVAALVVVFGGAYWFNVRRKGLRLRDIVEHGPGDDLDL